MARIFLVRINAAGKSCRRMAPTFGSKTLLTGKPNYDRGFHLCPPSKTCKVTKLAGALQRLLVNQLLATSSRTQLTDVEFSS
jgi:hypothetical protein